MLKYTVDTSALIEPWRRHYPISSFPGVWSKFEGLIYGQAVKAPMEVLKELKRKEDNLLQWVKGRSELIYPDDEQLQRAVQDIMGTFPNLVDVDSNRSTADPFVIGLARITGTYVVTYEQGGTGSKPKIPSVCSHYGIRCLTFTELIVEEGWVF